MEIGTMIAIGSLIASAISGVIQAVSNYNSTTETNKANLAQSQALNEEAWRRDDTSFQRAVADARAAGLSPLAAVDNAGFNTAPIMSTANAPQMDLSGLMGALGSTANFMGERSQQQETERHNKAQEAQAKKELAMSMRKIWNDNSQAAKAIRAEDKRILFKSHNESERKKSSDSIETRKAIEATTGLKIPAVTYTEYDKYIKAYAEANEAWAEIESMYTAGEQNKMNSISGSSSKTTNVGASSLGYTSGESSGATNVFNDKWRWEKAIEAWEYGKTGYLNDRTEFKDPKDKIRHFRWPEYISQEWEKIPK